MPTGRAPRRTSQAETYAVPQPSSIASSPSTPSSRCSSDSGMFQIPHEASVGRPLPLAGRHVPGRQLVPVRPVARRVLGQLLLVACDATRHTVVAQVEAHR